MPRRNELEHKALHVIVNNGIDGVLQSELWRKLDATSREGSRIALKLETKGLIRRERVLKDGRWTYRLYSEKRSQTINSISDCPCLLCPDASRCVSRSDRSPITCEKLTEWILTPVEKERNF